MNQSPQHFTNEKTGISYTLSPDGYYLPDLTLPNEPEYDIGIYGMMRKSYLKNHRRGLFTALLTTGKLYEHLYEIDQSANNRIELITTQMAEREDVTEKLKAENQLLWIQKMSCIRNQAQEIILNDLIYN